MQLPTDDTIHPQFIPTTKWFRGQDVNTVLDARVLRVFTCALGLHGRTDEFDGLSVGKVDICEWVVESKIRDPGVVFDYRAGIVKFPKGDLEIYRHSSYGIEIPTVRHTCLRVAIFWTSFAAPGLKTDSVK